MFNKTDCSSPEWLACCKAAGAIACHPRDYFTGLPDPDLVIPRNILLFSRREAMDLDRGTAHHRFLLIINLEGEGSVMVDDAVARLKPGTALLVTPFQFHHYARFSGKRLHWLFLTFEVDDVEAFAALRGQVLALFPLQVACLRQMVERYVTLEGSGAASPEITLLAAVLLEEFRRRVSRVTQEEPVSRRLIQDVALYVHRQATRPIRIPDVAREMGLSESHLRARFRALAGIGLGAYIQRSRLHRAGAMLLASEFRVKEIAERCGYDSIYSFSRAFRRAMGVSPCAYRKSGGVGAVRRRGG